MRASKLLTPWPLSVVVLLGCAAAPFHFEQAIIEPVVVDDALGVERQLNEREDAPIPDGGQWYEVVRGSVPIVITAPHSTRPLREGKRRFSDGGGTAAMALAIAKLTGATVIYVTYEGPSDPNYYDDNDFKSALRDVLVAQQAKLVLDLHGSHPHRSYDVDIGTMNGESLLGNASLVNSLIEHLQREGICNVSNNRFAASKDMTITKFASRRQVPAIQLEINSTWITPSQGSLHAQRFALLLQALVRYVRHVADQ